MTMTNSGRRQNSSCDPCRRSKKRCSFAPETQPGASTVCLNCYHLGYKCTFEFVTARAAQRRKRMMVPPTPSASGNGQQLPQSSLEMPCSPTRTPDPSIWPTYQPVMEQKLYLDDMFWTGSGSDTFLDFNSFLNTSSCDWTGISNQALGEQDPTDENIIQDPNSLVALEQLAPAESPRRRDRHDKLSGFWTGSPIQLLNSTFLNEQLSRNLSHIYDLMMTGLANRYLAYGCNQFAGTHRYTIEPENSAADLLDLGSGRDTLESNSSHAASFLGGSHRLHPAPSPINPGLPKSVESRRITLIGVARFLDNFGALYGNKLEWRDRKMDDSTLTAVLQAFALQSEIWNGAASEYDGADLSKTRSPESFSPHRRRETNSQIFPSAWFNAHSWLVKSKENRSFVHLHAVFLFHMIAQPEEARSKDEFHNSQIRFLDHALHQLQALLALVDAFCSHLDPKSRYRSLLESSTRIMRWYSYVRDTIASFTTDRHCILEDAPIPSMGMCQLHRPYVNTVLTYFFRHLSNSIFIIVS